MRSRWAQPAKRGVIELGLRAHVRTGGRFPGPFLDRAQTHRVAGPEVLFRGFSWLDSEPSLALAPPGRGVAYQPDVDGDPHSEIFAWPGVVRTDLSDVAIDPHSNAFLTEGLRVVVERPFRDHADRIDVSGGNLIAHRGTAAAIVRRPGSTTLPSGILLAGAGSFNYYHWIVEQLSKLEYLNDLGPGTSHLPLLVPPEALEISTFRETLRRTASRPVIALDRGRLTEVRHLVCISSPNPGAINLQPGAVLRADDFRITADSVKFLRRALATGRAPLHRRPSSGQRYYLTRPGGRRDYNQDELVELASRRGFRPINLASLDLDGQREVFQSASYIIGPSGAAWTNLLFASPGLRCLSWLPAEARHFSPYSTIAQHLEVDMKFMTYPVGTSVTSRIYSQPYRLDPSGFVGRLDAWLDRGDNQ